MHRFVGFVFFLMGVVIASGALLVRRQPADADYTVLANCISEARYQHPLDDEHHELVNAMYACGIYKLAAGYAAGAP